MHFVCNLALPTHYVVNSHGNSNSESSVHHFDLNAGLMEIQKKMQKHSLYFIIWSFSAQNRGWLGLAVQGEVRQILKLD